MGSVPAVTVTTVSTVPEKAHRVLKGLSWQIIDDCDRRSEKCFPLIVKVHSEQVGTIVAEGRVPMHKK